MSRLPPHIVCWQRYSVTGAHKHTSIARAVYYILSQPERSNILELRIAPAQQGL